MKLSCLYPLSKFTKTVEMFKVSRGLRPEIINELFQFSGQILYELRQRSQFQIPWIYSAFSSPESFKIFGPKI